MKLKEKNNEFARIVLGAMSNNVFNFDDFEKYINNYSFFKLSKSKIKQLLNEYRKNDLVKYMGNGLYCITGKLFN